MDKQKSPTVPLNEKNALLELISVGISTLGIQFKSSERRTVLLTSVGTTPLLPPRKQVFFS